MCRVDAGDRPGSGTRSRRDHRHRTAAEWSAVLGDVEPFFVRSCAPENGLKAGRRVELRLSKPLSPDIDATNAAQWFSVAPQPKNLRFDVRGSHVVIHGDFSLDRLYALRVLPGLPAAESPFRLDQAFLLCFLGDDCRNRDFGGLSEP